MSDEMKALIVEDNQKLRNEICRLNDKINALKQLFDERAIDYGDCICVDTLLYPGEIGYNVVKEIMNGK